MTKDISIPIYGSRVKVIYGENMDAELSDHYIDEDGFKNDIGLTVFFLDSNSFIIALKYDYISILAHESVHLAHRIMECVGISVTNLDDEIMAYLVGYISGEVWDIIQQENERLLQEHRYMKNFTL